MYRTPYRIHIKTTTSTTHQQNTNHASRTSNHETPEHNLHPKMTTQPSTDTIRVAILDDYASTSQPYFDPLLSTHKSLKVDYIPSTIPNYTSPADLQSQVQRLQPYQIISTMRERTKFPAELVSQLPNLKLLLTTAMHNAGIDVAACEKQGVVVCGTNVRGEAAARGAKKGGDTTNEQTWALLLGVMRGIAADDARVKTGGGEAWQDGMATGLAGRTLGLLGLGRLGLHAAVTGVLGFGMEVVCWSTNLTQEVADERAVSKGLGKGVLRVAKDKESFFREADVVSVHYVLSERSVGIVGEQELGWMKESAFLVNTSRGPLVDEKALVSALRAGKIRGAGLDVFDVEPLPADSP